MVAHATHTSARRGGDSDYWHYAATFIGGVPKQAASGVIRSGSD